MGIIQRQSIKFSIISYLGVLVGIGSTLFIYSNVSKIYGLYSVLMSITIILNGLFTLGIPVATIRFLPQFRNKKNGHEGFLLLILTGGTIGTFIFLPSFFLMGEPIITYFFNDEPLIKHYYHALVPLVICSIFFSIFRSYVSSFHRIVIPNIIDDLLRKITIPILFLAYIFGLLDVTGVVFGIVCLFVGMLLLIILYTNHLGQLSFKVNRKFWKKSLLKKMGRFAGFGILNNLAGELAFRIDVLMISGILDITASGIYAIINVMTQVIRKPANGVYAIASPIIAESWKDNDLKKIERIYHKSSATLFLIACYIFLGIWLSIDNLIDLMPDSEGMIAGKYVMFFIGINLVFELLTSVNSHIIAYSNFYKFNLYALLVLAGLNILFNYLFITQYGLVGAAIATLCSNSLYNLLKVGFIYYKFTIQPFTIATLKILILAIGSYLIMLFVPQLDHSLLDIVFRSVIFSICYLSIAYLWKISPDMNGLVQTSVRRFFKKGL